MSKKDNIMKAATELFARKGFDGTATSEIAQCAGVAQGTVFHHFKNKENLLIAICDELVREYVQGIKDAAQGPGNGWESLERVLRFSMAFLKESADAISISFRETRVLGKEANELHDHFRDLMQEIINVKQRCIERGMKDGSMRQVIPYETAFLLHIIIKGIHHSQMHGLLEVPDLDNEVVEFCRRSLSSEYLPDRQQV